MIRSSQASPRVLRGLSSARLSESEDWLEFRDKIVVQPPHFAEWEAEARREEGLAQGLYPETLTPHFHYLDIVWGIPYPAAEVWR